MKKTVTFFTFFGLFIFLNIDLSAQGICNLPCNDSLDIEPAFTCEDAQNSAYNGDGPGFVCTLDGYCLRNIDPPIGNNAPFCNGSACVLNNPVWLAFIPSENYIDIDVCPSHVIGGGDGVQWALYDQCDNLLNPVACQCTPVLPGDSLFNISTAVQAGLVYFLVIDGFSGSTFDLSFRVNEGIDGKQVGNLISDELEGINKICRYKTASITSQGFQYASKYEWTIDGDAIGGDSLTLNLNTDSLGAGAHSLCLKATNQCSVGEWKAHCWQIEVYQSEIVDTVGSICEGDLFHFNGNNYREGNYRLFFPDLDPNFCDTVVFLHVIPQNTPHYPDVHLVKCVDDPTIRYQGKDYSASASYYLLRYDSPVGCDTTTHLFVKNLIIEGSLTSGGDTISCLGGSDTLRLNYTLSGADMTNTTTENFWFDNHGEIIGQNTDHVIIHKPGEYKVKLLVTIYNPTGADQVKCEHIYSINIPGKDSPLKVPVIGVNSFLCEKDTVIVNITNDYPPGTQFHWSLPGGYLQTFNSGRSALVSLDSSGWYQLCVIPEDTCMKGPFACEQLQAFDAPHILSFGQDSTGSLSGILSAIIHSSGLSPRRITFSWAQFSGPGNSVIEHPDSLISAVTVDTAGLYVFTLSIAYDGFINCNATKSLSFIFTGTGARNHKIDENSPLASLISIYPNPVSKSLFIQSEIPVIEMSLTGPDGRKLMKSQFKETFDVRSYPAGVYMLQFVTEKGMIINKYIKK